MGHEVQARAPRREPDLLGKHRHSAVLLVVVDLPDTRHGSVLEGLGGDEHEALGLPLVVIHREVPGVARVEVDRQGVPRLARLEHLAVVTLVYDGRDRAVRSQLDAEQAIVEETGLHLGARTRPRRRGAVHHGEAHGRHLGLHPPLTGPHPLGPGP